jgi:DNA repair exonuclease SbcCD ATPase subunit
MATVNFDDQIALELLQSRNVARRMELQLRKRVQSRTWSVKVAKVKFASKEAPPSDLARELEVAQNDLQKAEEVAALSSKRQRELDELNRELTEFESAVDTELKRHQTEQFQKDQRIAKIRSDLHENARLQFEVSDLREANSQLREQLIQLLDDGSDLRREQAMFEHAQRNAEWLAEDARRGEVRLNERIKAIARRDQQIEKRKAEVEQKGLPIKEAEDACAAKLKEVLELEERTIQVELDLNKVLKETHLIACGVPIVKSVDKSRRTQEMEKVFGLVTKHEEVF